MNPDPTSTGQGWFDIAMCAILAVLGWFINRYVSKVDLLEKRQSALETHQAAQQATFITREELKEYLDEIRDDRMRMHAENLDNLREIRNDIKELVKR